MRRLALALVALSFAACNYEQPQEPMRMLFAPASGTLGECFSKLNIQLFDSTGAKVFSKVKVQNAGDSGFGSLSLDLADGTYTVVAVGHSSVNSATIKSPELVQFTASNGTKVSDTFCACQQIEVAAGISYSLTMERVTSMFRLTMEDEPIPDGVTKLVFDYTGGSANFNPTTSEGCTKSTQSETRMFAGLGSYDVFTFPYMSDSCRIKMTVSAVDGSGQVVHKRTFSSVPMVRNRITEYRGRFFSDDSDPWAVVTMTFTVDADWSGHDMIRF